jgi:hypothetical protein
MSCLFNTPKRKRNSAQVERSRERSRTLVIIVTAGTGTPNVFWARMKPNRLMIRGLDGGYAGSPYRNVNRTEIPGVAF